MMYFMKIDLSKCQTSYGMDTYGLPRIRIPDQRRLAVRRAISHTFRRKLVTKFFLDKLLSGRAHLYDKLRFLLRPCLLPAHSASPSAAEVGLSTWGIPML
eukprot:5185756-Pleurochrysis_carterae.AAC.1